MSAHPPPARLVGDGVVVPCADGIERTYINLDAAASTSPLVEVAEAVTAFVPMYSSVHRGAGYKSRRSSDAYESARESALRFCGSPRHDDIAIICRNTTEAINHLAYRLRLEADDVVLTTVVEHHANLLPWGRVRDPALRRVHRARDIHRRRRGGRSRRHAAAQGACR